MMSDCPTTDLSTQPESNYTGKSGVSSMSSHKLNCFKNLANQLKSLFKSPINPLFRRSSVPNSDKYKNSKYKVLTVFPEASKTFRSGAEKLTLKALDGSACGDHSSSGGTGGVFLENISETLNKTHSDCESKMSSLKIPGNISGITENKVWSVNDYKTECSKKREHNTHKDQIYVTGANCEARKLPMAGQNLSSTLAPPKMKPQIPGRHDEARPMCIDPLMPLVEAGSNLEKGVKKIRRRGKALPETVRKLKTGFLVSTNNMTEKMCCKEGVPVNVDKPFTCKKTFRKIKTKETLKPPKDWRSTPKREHRDSFESSEVDLKRQRLAKEGAECRAENQINERSHFLQNSVHTVLPNPILDYTFLSMDYFYTVIEQLHDQMDLVRSGIQQLIDNFTQPSIMRLQDQEARMLQFKQSVEMLQCSIERMNFAMIKLPDKISNMRYLLLPCRNTIREFNNHLQKMSVDLEHTQYFNNDSPMHTLLKMIVIIKTLNAVLSRGRRTFMRSIDLPLGGTGENEIDFDVSCYHERFIRPTFDMLFRRTEAMVKLRNFSVTLSQRWVDNQDWNSFLPSLQEFMKVIKMVEPFLAVPRDWYAVRILPETRIMHVFDGFMSEFYRAIVTPGFANSNPVAFGSIFVVIQFILDNIISQHVIILRDLNRGLNLSPTGSIDESATPESLNPMATNNLNPSVCRPNAPLYENVPVVNNVANEVLFAQYQNI